jgi:7-carboxy-7-deazaguanine synthase
MASFIHEIYLSLSGEGITTGIPTVFVRLAGCSLRCGSTKDGRKLWCDTGYALSPKSGEPLSQNEIIAKINELVPKNGAQILITGGEPLEGENRLTTTQLCKDYATICHDRNHPYPRIETNGAEPIKNLNNMVFTLDYKLPGSGMEEKMCLENLTILRERKNPFDELKFVVRDRFDFDRSIHIVHKFNPDCHILFSPVSGELQPEDLAEWIKNESIPKSRLSLQIHKILWGDKKGV